MHTVRPKTLCSVPNESIDDSDDIELPSNCQTRGACAELADHGLLWGAALKPLGPSRQASAGTAAR